MFGEDFFSAAFDKKQKISTALKTHLIRNKSLKVIFHPKRIHE